MSVTRVVFLETPVPGRCCLVEIDGKIGCTHKLVRVHQDAQDSSSFSVEMDTGAFCAGRAELTPQSRLRYELLHSLSRHNFDRRTDEIWAPLVGSVEQEIRSFVDQKLLQEAGLASKMERKFRMNDLKPIAMKCGAPQSGRKRQIIESILRLMPQEAAAGLVSDVLAYEATQRGQALLDRYLKLKARDREAMETAAVALLALGDVRAAGMFAARYEAAQVFPRGLGCDWAAGMPESTVKTASLLLQYSYDDLDIDSASRRQVAVQLALGELLGHGPRDVQGRIAQAIGTDDVPCDSLRDYLGSEPSCEYVRDRSSESTADLAEVYCNTYMFRASNRVELEQLRTERVGKGIMIDCLDDCAECCRGKRNFRWTEIDLLPVLPRHWGCRCLYAQWL